MPAVFLAVVRPLQPVAFRHVFVLCRAAAPLEA